MSNALQIIIDLVAIAGIVCVSLGQEWPGKEAKKVLRTIGFVLCMLSGFLCVCWLVYKAF